MKKNLIPSFIFLLAISTLAFAQGDTYKGENLYQLKCGRCHFAYAPEKYSPEEWKTVVNEMGPLSGLDEDSEKDILDYLIEGASKKEKDALPTSPVLAGYVYTEFFSYENKVDTFDVHYLNLNIAGRLQR